MLILSDGPNPFVLWRLAALVIVSFFSLSSQEAQTESLNGWKTLLFELFSSVLFKSISLSLSRTRLNHHYNSSSLLHRICWTASGSWAICSKNRTESRPPSRNSRTAKRKQTPGKFSSFWTRSTNSNKCRTQKVKNRSVRVLSRSKIRRMNEENDQKH